MAATVQKPIPSYTTPRRSDTIWNILTFIVLLGTACLVAGYAAIYLAPNPIFNPFPPASLPQAAVQPSATVTSYPTVSVPTVTTEPVGVMTSVPLIPTETAYVPEAVTLPAITPLPAVTNTNFPVSNSPYPFELRGQIATVASTIIRLDQGCSWQGVGGQVFDLQGAPLVGMSIRVGGKLNGASISLLSLTGTARQYGEAGFEFTLRNQPVDSHETLWIELLDQAGLPLSAKVSFNTYADCQKNLVLINFRQVK